MRRTTAGVSRRALSIQDMSDSFELEDSTSEDMEVFESGEKGNVDPNHTVTATNSANDRHTLQLPSLPHLTRATHQERLGTQTSQTSGQPLQPNFDFVSAPTNIYHQPSPTAVPNFTFVNPLQSYQESPCQQSSLSSFNPLAGGDSSQATPNTSPTEFHARRSGRRGRCLCQPCRDAKRGYDCKRIHPSICEPCRLRGLTAEECGESTFPPKRSSVKSSETLVDSLTSISRNTSQIHKRSIRPVSHQTIARRRTQQSWRGSSQQPQQEQIVRAQAPAKPSESDWHNP